MNKENKKMLLLMILCILIPLGTGTCAKCVLPASSSEQAIGFARGYYNLDIDETDLVGKEEVLRYSQYQMVGLHTYETYYLVDYDIECNVLFLRSFYVGVRYSQNDSSYFLVEKPMVIREWTTLVESSRGSAA